MKIFFLINTLRSGGAQQALASILQNFKNKDKKIILISIDKKNNDDSNIYNKTIKIIYLNKKINNFFPVLLKLFFLIIEHKPFYLVSTGNAQTIIYARIITFLTKINHISWIQFDYLNSKPKFFFKKIIWFFFFRLLYSLDKKIILISSYLLHRYNKKLNWNKKKLFIIPNTFSKIYLRNYKIKKNLPKIILCPGRLDYDKNHLKIIDALLMVKKKIKNFKCIFIGDKGNAYENILKKIKKYNLEKNIIIKEAVKSSNFIDILNSSYLILMLSKKEPFGVIALETIFLKKNFLLSSSSGFKDIIGNIKTRNIVNNFDNHIEIYNKIIHLYNKPLTLKEKNIFYERIIKKFESSIVYNKWLKIIK